MLWQPTDGHARSLYATVSVSVGIGYVGAVFPSVLLCVLVRMLPAAMGGVVRFEHRVCGGKAVVISLSSRQHRVATAHLCRKQRRLSVAFCHLSLQQPYALVVPLCITLPLSLCFSGIVTMRVVDRSPPSEDPAACRCQPTRAVDFVCLCVCLSLCLSAVVSLSASQGILSPRQLAQQPQSFCLVQGRSSPLRARHWISCSVHIHHGLQAVQLS